MGFPRGNLSVPEWESHRALLDSIKNIGACVSSQRPHRFVTSGWYEPLMIPEATFNCESAKGAFHFVGPFMKGSSRHLSRNLRLRYKLNLFQEDTKYRVLWIQRWCINPLCVLVLSYIFCLL